MVRNGDTANAYSLSQSLGAGRITPRMGTWQDKQTRIPIHSPRSHAAACSASTLLCRLVSGRGCTTVLHTRRAYSYCHIGDHSLPCSTSNPVSPRDLNRRLLSGNLDHSDIDRMRPLASFLRLRASSLSDDAMSRPTDHAHRLSRGRTDHKKQRRRDSASE